MPLVRVPRAAQPPSLAVPGLHAPDTLALDQVVPPGERLKRHRGRGLVYYALSFRRIEHVPDVRPSAMAGRRRDDELP